MVRHRSAFTLIELLIVVVVIGILTAIAIPKFAQVKGRSRAAAIKADLRNLATAQEEYLGEYRTYTTDLTKLPYTTSSGVIVTIVEATPLGWAATSTHPLSLPLTCAIFYGRATPVPPATVEGSMVCQ
jgi:prepilin-type N-terminal cleavage/methylation domain-containing protein